MPPQSTAPDPSANNAAPGEQLLSILFGFMVSQALALAAKLGIADMLKDGPQPVTELARVAHVQPQPLYRVLRALAAAGIFAEEEKGHFRLTPMAEVLRSDAAGSLRGFATYMGADWHWRAWEDLEYSVREGKPSFEEIYGMPLFEYLPKNPEQAGLFNNAMTSFSAAASAALLEAYDFSGIKKLVDVGGGHGFMLTSILEKYPEMQGIVFDAPPVVDGARKQIAARGLKGRCESVGGNFFEAVPGGGDAYVMKHIIHDWEDEKALKILRHCHQAMTPDGRILIIEMVIPEGNTPSLGKLLDLEMMVFLHSFERTEEEYRALYEQSGFELTRVVATNSPYSVIEGARR